MSDYLLVACVSGRSGRDARRLVGLDSIRYVGNHGLELHPDAAGATEAIAEFARSLGERWPIEDKGLSLSLHFREAKNQQEARAVLEQIAMEASAAGLDPRWGRKVLEIQPRLHADKGTAVAALLATAGATRALYAGDDTTDRDAFRAVERVELVSVIRIAVDSAEAPADLLSEADLVVDGPAELARHLSQLSRRRSA